MNTNTNTGLVDLAARLASAKRAEMQAREERVKAEEAIIAAVGFSIPEGSESYTAEGDGKRAKLTLKRPIYTKVDAEEWEAIRRTLPKDHPARGIFRRRYDLDSRAARKLQDDNARAWTEISGCITRRPGKIAVDLKELEIL